MPYKRRHFESCICGNYLYIIGGTGEFRAIQDNMFWYNYKEGNYTCKKTTTHIPRDLYFFFIDEWSKRIILPCSGRQLKCCEYKNQLFILSISRKCGYLFERNTSTWTAMNICDTENVVPNYSETFALFSYKDNIYIKSNSTAKTTKPKNHH